MRIGRPRLDGAGPRSLRQHLAGIVEQDGLGVGLADVEDDDGHGRDPQNARSARRALCDRGIVVDLSAMKGVFVDPDRGTARVRAGATLGDVDRETHLFGLAVPLGVVSKTGVAGLTLGGGVGWLVRKYGLTCDNVLSFDMVTAEGSPVTASAEKNADLFWALRGGGGNFGIVTSFLYQAHPVSTVLGGLIIYGRDQAGPVIRHYRDVLASAPEELTAYAGLISTPEGMPAVAVVACYCGDPADAGRAMQPLREFGSPLVDGIQRMPFPAMQKLLDDAFPDRACNYWKSTFVTALSDEVIDLVVEHADRARSPRPRSSSNSMAARRAGSARPRRPSPSAKRSTTSGSWRSGPIRPRLARISRGRAAWRMR